MLNLCSNFPYQRLPKVLWIPFLIHPRHSICEIWNTLFAKDHTFQEALSIVLRFWQFTSFRSTWCGYLLPVVLCLYVVEVIDFLFVSIFRLLFRIYLCFYFTIFWLFVQLLFFKQCLMSTIKQTHKNFVSFLWPFLSSWGKFCTETICRDTKWRIEKTSIFQTMQSLRYTTEAKQF